MSTNRIRILVNGERHEVERGSSVEAMLNEMQRDPRTVAIERNGELVKRPLFDSTTLDEGDRVEVVQFVQGG